MSYVKCIKNEPYIQIPGQTVQERPLYGLTVGKVYKTAPDRTAEKHGLIRVIDESYGEPGSEKGYLYPADYHVLTNCFFKGTYGRHLVRP